MPTVAQLAEALNIGDKLQSIYYGGEWHPASGTLNLISPSTGVGLCASGAAGSDDVAAAVAAATATFEAGGWSGLSGTERAPWLRKMAVALSEKREALKTLEAINVGRPIFETDGDIEDSLSFLEYNAGAAEKLDVRQGTKLDAPDGYNISMQYNAAGVAACILPFNWPLVNIILKLGPALAAGCCIVLKPSEHTPLTALAFAQICDEIGLPAGVVNIITGLGADTGAALVKHPGVHVVGFTGSVATGCQIARDAQTQDAAKFVFAEMGGKSAAIVLEDIDADRMANLIDWIMFGVFIGNGQACSATSRLLLHSAIASKLLPRLVAAVEGICIGDNMNPDTRLGPLITARQRDKVLGMIQRAIDSGDATSLTGDGRCDALPAELAGGNFVKPVIFTDVSDSAEVWREEIFGPVLCVREFSSDEEAISIANDSKYGLAGAVLGNDGARCMRICKALRVGCSWINCIQPMFPNTVWGGPGQSSIGRELGDFSLNNFLEPKQIVDFVGHRAEPLGWYASSDAPAPAPAAL